MCPFDAVLLVAFGGPAGRSDVRPFLANVLRGRRVTAERIEEVAHHYELFDGVSPITELTNRQAQALSARLRARGTPLPVYVGMRNWHPYLEDTFAEMARDGIRRAIGVIAAAHRSYSSCTQYRENVAAARAAILAHGLPDVDITYVSNWHVSDGFLDANASNVRSALDALPPDARGNVEIAFTAHSIPVSMAERYPYVQQLRESVDAIVARVPWDPHRSRLVFQSRSGRPEDPWLEPDVCDYLREAHTRGVSGVVVSPVGFVCDHIEVLYDLDVEAADAAREIGLPLRRAAAVNDHARFIDALADAVQETLERYRAGRPLPIAAPTQP